MIESYITRPTAFPMEAEEPWRIVEKLYESTKWMRKCRFGGRYYCLCG